MIAFHYTRASQFNYYDKKKKTPGFLALHRKRLQAFTEMLYISVVKHV